MRWSETEHVDGFGRRCRIFTERIRHFPLEVIT
jgi:hypothetical protein